SAQVEPLNGDSGSLAPLQSMGKNREAFRQIFFLADNVLRQLKLNGGEIPNAFDSRANHEFGCFLGGGRGNRQYSQENLAAPDKRSQLRERLDLAPIYPGADFFPINVKRAHEP